MPVILNELHIKMSITEGGKEGGEGNSTNASDGEGNEAIIAACIEKVMEILNDKQER